VFWGSKPGEGGAVIGSAPARDMHDSARTVSLPTLGREHLVQTASAMLRGADLHAANSQERADRELWDSVVAKRNQRAGNPAITAEIAARATAAESTLSRTVGSRAGLTEPRGESAKGAAESTFYNVLRTLISAVRVELVKGWDEPTLFVPPRDPPKDRFFPDTVKKEHPAYFVSLRKKREREAKQRQLATSSTSSALTSLKSDDTLQYTFDRRAISWTDRKATPTKAKKNKAKKKKKEEVEVGTPEPWSRLQNLSMVQRRERCEHVVAMLQEELSKEVQRQATLVACPPHKLSALRWQVARERAEAGDWIMRILHEYRFVSATVMVDYLRETLESDEAFGVNELRAIRDGRRVGKDSEGKTKDLLDLIGDDLLREDEETKANRREGAKWEARARKARQRGRADKGTFDAIAAETELLALTKAQEAAHERERRAADAARRGQTAKGRKRPGLLPVQQSPMQSTPSIGAPDDVLLRAAMVMGAEGRGLSSDALKALPRITTRVPLGDHVVPASKGAELKESFRVPTMLRRDVPEDASVASTAPSFQVRPAVLLPQRTPSTALVLPPGRTSGASSSDRLELRNAAASVLSRRTGLASAYGDDDDDDEVAVPHITPGSMAAMAGIRDVDSPLLPELDVDPRVAQRRLQERFQRQQDLVDGLPPERTRVRPRSREVRPGDDDDDEDDDDEEERDVLRVDIVERMRLQRNPDGSIIQPQLRWTRTDVEAAIEATHDTVNVKDTVGLMLKLLKQQPTEPPNGRYSHLIGRWMQGE
jgi:hypothetical protein